LLLDWRLGGLELVESAYAAASSSAGMSFDAIAPHYRWLETVTAGPLLQQCRTAFLGEFAQARHVLLLGEGRGRFLLELMRVNCEAQITCVDASARMLALTREAVRNSGFPEDRVRFVHTDVVAEVRGSGVAAWGDSEYDAVASHFFLDCFAPEQLRALITTVAACVAAGSPWLISDFCIPERGWQRVRARLILAGLYRFFRTATKLHARRLTAPDGCLGRMGFQLKERRRFNWGLLHSDLWVWAAHP